MGLSGVINLDKPAGISSAFAVNKVKRLLPRGTKIGHAGTLDPFATGVLLLLIGKGTKLCELFMGQPKRYDATIKFGSTTPTDDPESTESPWPGPVFPLQKPAIETALPTFTGTILQTPPVFSAMKVQGRRAYDLARKGNEVQLAPRPVQVYSLEIISYEWPLLTLRIDCGRGTYIRSLARDLGALLNVGGHLTQLRRTRIGQFDASQSVTLEQLATTGIESFLTPLDQINPASSIPLPSPTLRPPL